MQDRKDKTELSTSSTKENSTSDKPVFLKISKGHRYSTTQMITTMNPNATRQEVPENNLCNNQNRKIVIKGYEPVKEPTPDSDEAKKQNLNKLKKLESGPLLRDQRRKMYYYSENLDDLTPPTNPLLERNDEKGVVWSLKK